MSLVSEASRAPGVGKSVLALDLSTNYHEAAPAAAGAAEGRDPTEVRDPAEARDPIILLHGSGPGVSAWTNWRRVIPALADRWRVLAPDMAGFGFTERRADLVYDIKLWVKHLIAFMDAVGVARANLIGNSFGGSLALAAALRAPERIGRLVLMGTPCDKFNMTAGLRAGWYYEPSIENMRAVMSLFPFDASVITDELVRERYETSLIPGAQEGLRKLLVKPSEDGETPLSGMPAEAVARITQPTLILHGREDRVIPVEMGLRLANHIPNAEFHQFGRCGHWVQAERNAAFIALARAHFS